MGKKCLDQSSEKKKTGKRYLYEYLTINIVAKPTELEPRFGRGECLDHSAGKKDEPDKQEVEMDTMLLIEVYSLMNGPQSCSKKGSGGENRLRIEYSPTHQSSIQYWCSSSS